MASSSAPPRAAPLTIPAKRPVSARSISSRSPASSSLASNNDSFHTPIHSHTPSDLHVPAPALTNTRGTSRKASETVHKDKAHQRKAGKGARSRKSTARGGGGGKGGSGRQTAIHVLSIMALNAGLNFAFYGIVTITQPIITTDLNGSTAEADLFIGWLLTVNFFMALLGGVVADVWLGKFWTIVGGAVVVVASIVSAIVAVHAGSNAGLFSAMLFVAVGNGVTVPCFSSFLGDQMSGVSSQRASSVFSYFYFSVQVGGVIALLGSPVLQRHSLQESLLFLLLPVAALLPLFAIFRRKYVVVMHQFEEGHLRRVFLALGVALVGCVCPRRSSHSDSSASGQPLLARAGADSNEDGDDVQASSRCCWTFSRVGASEDGPNTRPNSVNGSSPEHVVSNYGAAGGVVTSASSRTREALDDPSIEETRTAQAIGRVLVVFAPMSLFYGVYFQIFTIFAETAGRLDRHVGSYVIPSHEITALNAVMDILLIPFITELLMPALKRRGCVWPLRPLSRMLIGIISAALAMAAGAILEYSIERHSESQRLIPDADRTLLSVWWMVPQFLFVSIGEVLLAVTGLEYAYSQVPSEVRAMVTSSYWLTLAVGSQLQSAFANIPIEHHWLRYTVSGSAMALTAFVFGMATRGKNRGDTDWKDSAAAATSYDSLALEEPPSESDVSRTRRRDHRPQSPGGGTTEISIEEPSTPPRRAVQEKKENGAASGAAPEQLAANRAESPRSITSWDNESFKSAEDHERNSSRSPSPFYEVRSATPVAERRSFLPVGQSQGRSANPSPPVSVKSLDPVEAMVASEWHDVGQDGSVSGDAGLHNSQWTFADTDEDTD